MKAKKTSKKKALPIGITFPLVSGTYEVREAGEQSAADALSKLMRDVDHALRTVYKIEAVLDKKYESSGGALVVEISRRVDDFIRVNRPIMIGLENRLSDVEARMDRWVREKAARDKELTAKLDAVAEGNITNHNRLNAVEARLPKVKR